MDGTKTKKAPAPRAAKEIIINAVCPACEYSLNPVPDKHGKVTPKGYELRCDSCAETILIKREQINDDLQHVALVLLGEAEMEGGGR